MKCAWAFSVGGLLLLLTARPARADDAPSPSSTGIAQALFEEGTELLRQGDVAAACPKLAESHRLAPAGGTVYNLAICLENAGKTASAYVAYDEALARGVKDGQSERANAARDRMEALRPKLVRLVVRGPVSAPPSDLAVRLDGVAVRAEAWGTSLPVDPGVHTIDVSAPLHGPIHVELSLDEAGRVYEWRVPVLAPSAPPPMLELRAEEPPRSRKGATLPALLLASGGAFVVAGSVFGVLAANAHAESDRECAAGPASCSRAGVDAERDASRFAWGANLGIGLGVVALAAGAYLLLAR